jgi:membrane-associated phospholipid phosphatase
MLKIFLRNKYKLYRMKRLAFIFIFFQTAILSSFSQEIAVNYAPIPIMKVFYNMGGNIGGSFTYNYGLNHLVAIAGSYGIIKGGIDWKWHQLANENRFIPNSGMPSVIIGGLVPIGLPIGLYCYGRSNQNRDLQVTALALGQAALLSLAISSTYKAFTGRKPPGILHANKNNDVDFSDDFHFGFLRRGAFNGWPSGHTMVAFAMATTLTELYPDNTALKIGSFAYASIIGIGVSTNIHWLSDAFAGALMGYAIGKTVGLSFKKLMKNSSEQSKLTLIALPMQVGFSLRF